MKVALDAGTPPATFVGRRVGVFRIHHVLKARNGWMFSFTGNGDGYAHVTGGRSSLYYNHGADGQLDGNWYWYASD